MNEFITVCLAGINVGITSCSDFMRRFCNDYLTNEKPTFNVSVTEEKINEELKNAVEPTTFDYAEALCLYREIAEIMPLYDRIVFHGAAITYENKAYVFTAPSGTGKSTHISLWRKYLGEKVGIINGDKPVLSLSNGVMTVHGTPYAGKEDWQKNTSAVLGGICFLSQGKENVAKRVLPKDAFTRLFLQTYKPYSAEAMKKTVGIVSTLAAALCCSLSCDISEKAVKASFEALTKEKYPEV